MYPLLRLKPYLCFFFILMSSLTKSVYGQGKPPKLLFKKDKEHYMTGYVYELRDSSILMFKELKSELRRKDLIEIKYTDLYTIEHLDGRGSDGMMRVGLLGMCVGGLIGYAHGNDPPRASRNSFINFSSRGTTAGEKAIGGSLIGLVTGIIVGKLLFKSGKHTIIDNKYKRFERQKLHLRKYQMIK